jgi:mannose-6-phosphate isomerase-like protein (cupin superfamily)
MVDGPDAALAAIEKLAADPRRRDYCCLPAVRAHILEQVNRTRPRNTAAAGSQPHSHSERERHQNHAQRNSQPMPVIRTGTLPDGNLEGADYGASISLIVDESGRGQGPRLHRHPYDETWVVQDGHLTFQSGDELFAIGAGDIVIVPPGVPHKFTNNGPGRSKLICIHASPTFIGEWLE